MTSFDEQTKLAQYGLRDQFAELEDVSRSEFDDNGWNIFTDKIIEFTNGLYLGTRREFISRVDNERTLKYSGKDVERASMHFDFQRLYRRKRKRYAVQIGVLVGSLFTGITANWAFTDINGKYPSVWPWIILLVVLGITIVFSSLGFIKEMEP